MSKKMIHTNYKKRRVGIKKEKFSIFDNYGKELQLINNGYYWYCVNGIYFVKKQGELIKKFNNEDDMYDFLYYNRWLNE